MDQIQTLQQAQQRYVDHVMEKFNNNEAEKLSTEERTLAEKCIKAEHRVKKILKDLETLRSQIAQGEARVRSMERALEGEQGRIDGFVEVLLEYMPDDFGPQGPGPNRPPPAELPPPANRKQKRAAASKARKSKSKSAT